MVRPTPVSETRRRRGIADARRPAPMGGRTTGTRRRAARRFRDQILVRDLRVEPIAEHLDGTVHGDVLGDHKLSHVYVDPMRATN